MGIIMKKNFLDLIYTKIKKYIIGVDKLLIFLLISLSIFSIYMIDSAAKSVLRERSVTIQTIGLILGIIMMIIISKIDYDILSDLSPFLVAFSSIALIVTIFLATNKNGNYNWIEIGPINVQTSEFTKIAFAITFSTHLFKIKEKLNNIVNVLLLIVHFLLYFIPVVLQRDIGSALVYVFMFIVMLFVAGIYYRYLVMGVLLVAGISPIIWQNMKIYQKSRILFALQPELDPLKYGFQPLQSRMALGSGQFSGLGYGKGIQTQNELLPESHTDFIFAIIGEEFGFVGCLIVLTVLTVIIILIIRNAYKSKNETGYYICFGIAAMIMFQMLINVGMCIGLSPVIGITLPFVSYGGSSILSLYIAIGIVMSVRMKPEKKLKFKIEE